MNVSPSADRRRAAERRPAPRSCRGTRAARTAPVAALELEDRAAVGARELAARVTIVVEHLVEVEARAHRLADLAERAQLLDRARCAGVEELTFWIAIAPCAAKVVTSPIVRVVERLDLGAPERSRPDDPVVGQHRRRRAACGSRRARAPRATGSRGRPARRRSGPCAAPAPTRPTSVPARRHRVLLAGSRGTPADPPTRARDPVDVALRLVHVPPSAPHSRTAWRTTVSNTGSSSEVRAPDRLEHLARGRLLLDRVGEVPRQPRDAVPACDRRFRLGRHGMVPSWLCPDTASISARRELVSTSMTTARRLNTKPAQWAPTESKVGRRLISRAAVHRRATGSARRDGVAEGGEVGGDALGRLDDRQVADAVVDH